MKIKTTLAVIALMLAPALAHAACGHDEVAMNCLDGKVYDPASKSCVTVTG
ncbi:hypothetical protein RNZ50_13765 [Paracoccaceae bacterium Fryx2]|nr:hypothetical protein [Paracoccaceae bacterium Fryx2]